ncbi:MAG: helix-turn-helix domain-containing protein [Clostridia bacterium]
MEKNYIKQMRKKKNMTQEELAKKIGVKRSVVSKYETGSVEPTVSQIRKIANALECSVYDLIDSGFGALDSVLPSNMLGANLDHAKIDQKFLRYLLLRLSNLDYNSADYIAARNNILALAESSGLTEEAERIINVLENPQSYTSFQQMIRSLYTADNHFLSDEEKELYEVFIKLNDYGKKEAIKRIKEMLAIPDYRKK